MTTMYDDINLQLILISNLINDYTSDNLNGNNEDIMPCINKIYHALNMIQPLIIFNEAKPRNYCHCDIVINRANNMTYFVKTDVLTELIGEYDESINYDNKLQEIIDNMKKEL